MDVSRVSGARPGAGSFAAAEPHASPCAGTSEAQGAAPESRDDLQGAPDSADARDPADAGSSASANEAGTRADESNQANEANQTAEPDKTDQPVQSTASQLPASQREDDVEPAATQPLPRADIQAGSLPTSAAATADEHSRVKRGSCQGAPTNAEIFRERRGGDRLRARAADCVKFDQFDYQKKCRYPETGACDGIVLEAMRRVDRGAEQPDRTLFAEVQGMRNDADADSSSAAHQDFCEHVDNFQTNAYRLGFSYYTPLAPDNLKARYAAPSDRLRAMRDDFALMQPADMAYLQIGMEASGTLQERGHALLVQRGDSDDWTIFDPNNGAFRYGSRTDMQRSLEGYLDVAFSSTEWRASPVQMQVYSRLGRGGSASAPVLASRPGTPGSNPPESDYDYQLYADTALRPYPLTPAAIFEGARRPLAGVDRNEALASYALRMVGDHGMPDFRGALEPLDPRSLDQPRRLQLLDTLRRQHGSMPMASSVDVAAFIRHAGDGAIGSSDQLINDLETNFGSNYFSDSATRGSRNTMVVIDLARQTPPADGSASGFARSDPLLIRRIASGNDYRTDRYELLAPDYGIFVYADFEHMSSAVRRAFLSGRHTEGGVRDAATTWYAEDAGGTPAGQAALSNPHDTLNLSFPVVPVADLPPPVATAVNLPSGPYPHADFKRAGERTARNAEPDFLFRPSTLTPQEMSTEGGFHVLATSLKDVNLVTHDFDVGSGKRDLDSAGYLATFADPGVALDRLKRQGRSGFIYVISPGPSLVDVNATLGRHASAPDNREFAAMGTIDATQVMGWWESKDGVTSDFTDNPAYRWDVYGTQRTAGAQPQLARFALNSKAWLEPAYQPFVVPAVRDGKVVGHTPKDNPNFTQAVFYGDALQRLDDASRTQAAHEEYRGPMTLHAYGGAADHPAILYADASDNVYVNWTYRSSTQYPSNIKQFVMGSDGRFHYPRDWNKTLRVGSDGYLHVGSVPGSSSLNGVFRYDNGRLVHAQDGKYLTVGHTVYEPFVTTAFQGARSTWKLTAEGDVPVTPPASNRNSYRYARDTGTSEELYRFDQRPELFLPAGTTHFVTHIPTLGIKGKFLDWMNDRHRDVLATIGELERNNAAFLFRDGFYAFGVGPDLLEVRTLGGRRAYWILHNPRSGSVAELPQMHIASNYSVRADVWAGIEARARLRERLRWILGH